MKHMADPDKCREDVRLVAEARLEPSQSSIARNASDIGRVAKLIELERLVQQNVYEPDLEKLAAALVYKEPWIVQ